MIRQSAAAGILLATAAGSRGADEDLARELRAELDALRTEYEGRIDRLEARIRELEGRQVRRPEPAPAAPVAPAPLPSPETALDESPDADLRRRRAEAETTFETRTESRDYRRADAGTPLDQRIEDILEGYLEIDGYYRAGYGRSDSGGPQRAFGLPGVAKYRLGNEAENYGELNFAKTFFAPGAFSADPRDLDGPVARMNLRLAFYNPYDNLGSGSDTEFSVPELWASFGNLFGTMPEVKFWAGSRFYRRHDIHINDFYFWDMSGGGAGIEDLPIGNGKLAAAWIGDGAESAIYDRIGTPDPLNSAGFSKGNLDFRYYDWPFWGGTGELGFTWSRASSGLDSEGVRAGDAHGFALSLVRTRTGFADEPSLHKTSLQVGNGPAKTFTSGFETFSDPSGTYIRPDPDDSWRVRLTDHLVVKPVDCLSLGTALVYQYTDFGPRGLDQHWASAGVRPVYHFNDWASLALEGGVDWVSNSPNGRSGTLGKLTLAPQVSLGDEFFSRPALRAFVTYAFWSDGMRGQVGGADYAMESDGWSWGLQMESWW